MVNESLLNMADQENKRSSAAETISIEKSTALSSAASSTLSSENSELYQTTSTSSSSLPIARCCNCSSQSLENRPLKPCIKCQSVAYCSRDCQKMDYKNHKKSCAAAAQVYASGANFRTENRTNLNKNSKEKFTRGLQKWQFDT
ncbi:putative mynd domain [Golovinomyces cichoracearum]|uniref:Putative mynd domain n=1 Tax=Golovinomyces cichoracearum TaxID=62708 RepID=A0A420IV74_9PEZI|nr:putative mynd domain [Golovinomyces cichoracearum]